MLIQSSSRRLLTLAAIGGVIGFCSSLAEGFIFNAFTAYPQLHELASAQTDCLMSIRLEIGKKGRDLAHSASLFLDGLQLQLSQAPALEGHVKLPGAQGPHPKTSSGARDIEIQHLPYFIGLEGMKKVPLQKGAWEMIVSTCFACGACYYVLSSGRQRFWPRSHSE